MTSVAAMPRQTAAAPWQALGIEPSRALRLVGMRRSGNHAICNWLQRNAPGGRSLFLNNCRPGMDPLRSCHGVEVSGQPRAVEPMTEAAQSAGEGALLLVSYEDTVHARFDDARQLSGPYTDAAFDCDVLIYRSALNWLASLLRKLQANAAFRAADRMAVLVRALATYADLLDEVATADRPDRPARTDRTDRPARSGRSGRVAICYDNWTRDELYRARVLGDLGLPLRDNDLGEVQSYGGGSSFQKDVRQAGDLRSDQRWLAMRDDPEYQAVLRLAALDHAFCRRVAAHFPEDAERLTRIAGLPGFGPEVLT
ncbi:MAG: hypothetical protein BM562_08940 [Alphaproteobacteria bacterium MedPE-SWcel]|nr:MAG: hypothetical protein BM562_08940 [Alphaproteobacteria bacterium MedPE-SWcel]